MNNDITTHREMILSLDWIVAPPTDQPAPPALPEPPYIDDTPGLRPWAKYLLTGALAMAVIWLAGLAIIILDNALFADAVVRGAWAVGGIPIITMLTIALFADPYRHVGDDIYRAFNPVGQCAPSRNTITGGRQ